MWCSDCHSDWTIMIGHCDMRYTVWLWAVTTVYSESLVQILLFGQCIPWHWAYNETACVKGFRCIFLPSASTRSDDTLAQVTNACTHHIQTQLLQRSVHNTVSTLNVFRMLQHDCFSTSGRYNHVSNNLIQLHCCQYTGNYSTNSTCWCVGSLPASLHGSTRYFVTSRASFRAMPWPKVRQTVTRHQVQQMCL